MSDSDEYENLKKKLLEMHILDGLDYLNNELNIMEDNICSGLLREYVQELKGMLPDSYDEKLGTIQMKNLESDGELQFERSSKV